MILWYKTTAAIRKIIRKIRNHPTVHLAIKPEAGPTGIPVTSPRTD